MAGLSITTAWNEAAEFVKREARLLFPLAFMLVALPMAVARALAPQPAAPGQMPEAGAWLALVPLVIVASVIGNLAISYLALTPGTSVGEAIGRGARRLLAFLGMALLLVVAGAILLLVLGTVIMMLVPGALDAASAGRETPALETAGLVTILVLLPALVYFGARLFLVTPVTAAENVNPIAILGRSWALTSGHVWKLVAFLLLIALLVGVLSSAIESVIGIFLAIVAGPNRPGSTTALLIALVMAAVNTVITAYLTSLIARVYAQLAGGSTSGS